MKRINFFLMSILLLFTLSCATTSTRDAMQSWMGHDKAELLRDWGPPTSVFPDGKGGEIYTYSYNQQTGGWAIPTKVGVYYTAPEQYQTFRQFYINDEEKIYWWRFQD